MHTSRYFNMYSSQQRAPSGVIAVLFIASPTIFIGSSSLLCVAFQEEFGHYFYASNTSGSITMHHPAPKAGRPVIMSLCDAERGEGGEQELLSLSLLFHSFGSSSTG
jgi:hypothetical protein